MGLDMYLTASRYLNTWDKNGKDFETSMAIKDFFPELKDTRVKVKEAKIEVGYWRKANAIHKWFVDNVQYGEDDCGEYFVSRINLEKLREICTKVLEYPGSAEDLLPVASGFFFGSTNYDEYYFQDIKHTIEVIEECLKLPPEWDINYRSSW